MKVGDIYSSNSCGDLKVVRYVNNQKVTVKFIKTGFTLTTAKWCIEAGKVRDPNVPSFKGVGYIGFGDYKPTINRKPTKAFQHWQDMISRCYSEKYLLRRPTYIGCEVCESWKSFQNFAKWFYENYPDDGVNIHLDKDSIIKGNKVYRPEACSFISVQENTFHASDSRRKEFSLVSEDGDVIKVNSLRKLEKDTGLSRVKIAKLVQGKLESVNGYKLMKVGK